MTVRSRSKHVVTAVLIAVGIGGYFVYLANQRQVYRAKLSSFTAGLAKSNADTKTVRDFISQPRFKGLKLREHSGTLWEVETPSEFGARSWILLIELRGSKVAALRVRTDDSTETRPEGAPPDKLF